MLSIRFFGIKYDALIRKVHRLRDPLRDVPDRVLLLLIDRKNDRVDFFVPCGRKCIA
jgi:hypothetical protein